MKSLSVSLSLVPLLHFSPQHPTPSILKPKMASIPCAIHLNLPTSSSSSSSSSTSLGVSSPFLAFSRSLGWLSPSRMRSRMGPTTRCGRGSGCAGARCWFKFGNRGVDAEGAGIYGSQSRDDFNRDDVEQYFNYMGMLAVEGTYKKMEALLNQNIHPVDILLMLAASEGDKPKIEEVLRAGASYDVRDADGRTALDRASRSSEEIKDFILGFSVKSA